jgi:hypothetical protein
MAGSGMALSGSLREKADAGVDLLLCRYRLNSAIERLV